MKRTIYTLSDFHVSGDPQRNSQEKWGPVWVDHRKQIETNWRELVGPDDIMLINGDTSWSSSVEQAMEDLTWIASLPGTKYLCEGNHCSGWWKISKLRKAFKELGITDTFFTTYQDTFEIAEGIVLVGGMGWYGPRDRELFVTENPAEAAVRWRNDLYERAMLKFYQHVIEMRRALERTKEQYPDHTILVQTHFPPRNEMFELMKEYKVAACVYGHLHGETQWMRTENIETDLGGVDFRLVATDFVLNVPQKVLELP